MVHDNLYNLPDDNPLDLPMLPISRYRSARGHPRVKSLRQRNRARNHPRRLRAARDRLPRLTNGLLSLHLPANDAEAAARIRAARHVRVCGALRLHHLRPHQHGPAAPARRGARLHGRRERRAGRAASA